MRYRRRLHARRRFGGYGRRRMTGRRRIGYRF